MSMDKVLLEKRTRLKQLRAEKKTLIANMRKELQRKKDIDKEMSQLRQDIRHVKGLDCDW